MSITIFEKLNTIIADITKVKNQESKRDNLLKQKETDKKFKEIVLNAGALVDTLVYAKTHFNFVVEQTTIQDLQRLYQDMPNVIENEIAKRDAVNRCGNSVEEIRKKAVAAWNLFYPSYIAETRNTLLIIGKLDSKSDQCIKLINQGNVFSLEKDELKSLDIGMREAAALIEGLGLDSELKSFLQRMNSGQATLADLDDKVKQWLTDENLEKKIKLSFIG